MYDSPFLLVGGIAAIALLYVVGPAALVGHRRFRNRLRVSCPEARVGASVQVGALSATLSEFRPRTRLEAVSCSLWPERAGCRQDCMTAPASE